MQICAAAFPRISAANFGKPPTLRISRINAGVVKTSPTTVKAVKYSSPSRNPASTLDRTVQGGIDGADGGGTSEIKRREPPLLRAARAHRRAAGPLLPVPMSTRSATADPAGRDDVRSPAATR